jgi:hypothetical protein
MIAASSRRFYAETNGVYTLSRAAMAKPRLNIAEVCSFKRFSIARARHRRRGQADQRGATRQTPGPGSLAAALQCRRGLAQGDALRHRIGREGSATGAYPCVITTFPKWPRPSKCRYAALASAKGNVRSITGRMRCSTIARFIASKSARLPTLIEPRVMPRPCRTRRFYCGHAMAALGALQPIGADG